MTDKERECEGCIDAIADGYTICGDCSVPWCANVGCGAMSKKDCKCGPIADNE